VIVRFREHRSFFAQVAGSVSGPAGTAGKNDFGARPICPDPLGERKAIHGTGHFNIAEDDVDRQLGVLKDQKRLVGIDGLNHFEPAFPQVFGNHDADQHLVFHDEHGFRRPA